MLEVSPLNFRRKSKQEKNLHEGFAEITREIKRLEQIGIENCKKIQRLHQQNKALTKQILLLKIRRTKLAFRSDILEDVE